MKIQLCFNGDLEMSASPKMRKRIKQLGVLVTCRSEAQFVSLHLEPLGYKQIKPEDRFAMTSATLITDGKNIWGDMNYAERSFLEELVAGNTVTWQKG